MHKQFQPITRGAYALLLGVALALFAPAVAAQAEVTNVTIYDQADVLDDSAVEKQIAALSSDQDLHIAVLVSDDPTLSDSNYDEDIKSLIDGGDYADIAGSGEQTLKPDILLITISPDLRKLGVYAGDDIPRADQIADHAVGEMKDPARDGDWNATAVVGAESSLKAVNGDFEREQKERAERFESTVASLLGVGAVVLLIFVGFKLIPPIFETISDHRERKRLLAWSPTQDEVGRAVDYWRGLEQRLDSLASESTAMEDVVRRVSDEEIGRAVAEMEESGVVPDWVKTSARMKPLIEEGVHGGASGGFWSREVQPLVDRVRAGKRDRELSESVFAASDVSEDVDRFVRKYGKEVDLSPENRSVLKKGSEALRATVKQTERMADAQKVSPWAAAAQIDKSRHEFELLSKQMLRGPVRHGMSESRRREVSEQSAFSSQGLLSTLLPYSAISSSSSASLHSSNSSSSYSSISTSGFSGGSGSF